MVFPAAGFSIGRRDLQSSDGCNLSLVACNKHGFKVRRRSSVVALGSVEHWEMLEKASSNVKDSSLMMTVDDSFRDCSAFGYECAWMVSRARCGEGRDRQAKSRKPRLLIVQELLRLSHALLPRYFWQVRPALLSIEFS